MEEYDHINRCKKRCILIISINVENRCLKARHLFKVQHPFMTKIQHPFMTKILQKVGVEGTCLNIIKAIYDKPTANIILIGEKLKNISFKIRNKTMMSKLTTFIQHSFGSPSHSYQKRKRNKRSSNWQRRTKTVTVCRWHDAIHRKF